MVSMLRHMETMLSAQQYADHIGRSFKSVNNYLRAGRLPGARKDDLGRWMIPADARPTTGALAAVEQPAQPPAPVTVAGVLDVSPGYLELDVAARLLGITEYAVRAHRDRYRLEPVGHRGRLLMPQAVVREVLGLR